MTTTVDSMNGSRDSRSSGGKVILAARRISAGYKGVAVVRDIDLEVARGEVVLLAGPNGAGKTTTLMALAGALDLMSGHVEVEGVKTSALLHQRTRAGLGVITERRTVFNGLTTLENLKLGRGPVETALDQFPLLKSRLNVRAGLLSGGEQQMLCLARVLAAKPKTIVVDEMSFGLAPLVVARLLAALRDAADDGAAVLLVEQHVQQCLRLVDRVYFMRWGSIVESGSARAYEQLAPAELAKHYL